MDWIRLHRPAPGMIFGLLAALIALGGVAFAAIPDSGGSINACYNKKNGFLRVIDDGQSCTNGENAISWKDGIHGKVADSDKLDGKDSTDFLGATAKAADSDKLDGKDSTDFLGATAKAADSDKLDGKDSTDFGGLTEGIEFESDFLGVPITGPFVTVASSPTLDPGAYLVIGRASVTNHPTADGVACRMKTLIPDETFHDVVAQNHLIQYVLPLVAHITLPEAASVIIECGGPRNATARAKADVLRLDAAG